MQAVLKNLPTLGIGVSLSLSAEPDPVQLAQQQNGPAFVEYAGLVDIERIWPELARVQSAGVPLLFHPSFINFCGSFANSPNWLQTAARHIEKSGSPWFAQDCAYCFQDDGFGYSSQFGYFVPPIFTEASLQKAIERVREVQAMIPVPVAIEPPPLTFVVGDMPLFEFFGKLAEACDCAILLDMGHLVSWEMASGGRVLDAINALPCERVVEVHIAGGKLKQGEGGPVYIDAHEATILEQTWQMLEQMLPRLPNVKALCYECEGVDGEAVMNTLGILRDKVRALCPQTELARTVEQQA